MIRALRSKLAAKRGANRLTVMPMATGTVVMTNTPTMIRPTEISGALAPSMKWDTERATMIGRVRTLCLMMPAVSDTESAVSPRAR